MRYGERVSEQHENEEEIQKRSITRRTRVWKTNKKNKKKKKNKNNKEEGKGEDERKGRRKGGIST